MLGYHGKQVLPPKLKLACGAWANLPVRESKSTALAACAFAWARFSVSLYEFKSQFKNLNISLSCVLFLAVLRLLCSPFGKASTTVLVMDEDTGTSSRSAARSQESCSLVLKDISVCQVCACVLWFYSGASLALARGKTERGGLGNLLRETPFKRLRRQARVMSYISYRSVLSRRVKQGGV